MTHITAFGRSFDHRKEVLASESCGCFSCCAVFKPSEIKSWVDRRRGKDEGRTALCPKCGEDRVLGSKSGYPINKGSLEKMRDYWFGKGN